MKNPIGLSVVAALSDRSTVDDFGWGMVFHYNHVYSLGVTKHGDSKAYFLSMDLMKLYTEVSSDSKRKFKKFKDKLP